jgi:hypothetical protein
VFSASNASPRQAPIFGIIKPPVTSSRFEADRYCALAVRAVAQDQLHGRVTCGAWSADDPELAMIHTEVTLH